MKEERQTNHAAQRINQSARQHLGVALSTKRGADPEKTHAAFLLQRDRRRHSIKGQKKEVK